MKQIMNEQVGTKITLEEAIKIATAQNGIIAGGGLVQQRFTVSKCHAKTIS